MKKMISLLLALVLMLGTVTAAAAADSGMLYDKKFASLIAGMGIEGDYDYRELYVHNDPDWALVFASSGATSEPSKAVFGDMVASNPESFYPFSMGYGVYDKASGVFYDLVDAWDMRFDGLHEAVASLTQDDIAYEHMGSFTKIGDADGDGYLTILDATRIQRYLAELDKYPDYDDLSGMRHRRGYDLQYITDYDRDGYRTVLDATKIQRTLAELPNYQSYRVLDARGDISTAMDVDSFSALCKSYAELRSAVAGLNIDLLSPHPYTFAEDNAGMFTEDYFKTHAVAVVYTGFTDYGYSQEVEGVYIDAHGLLNIDIEYDNYNTYDTYEDMLQNLLTVIEIDSAFLDEIGSVTVNRSVSRNSNIPTGGVDYDFAVELEQRIDKPTEKDRAALISSPAEGVERTYEMTHVDYPLNITGSFPEPVFDEEKYDETYFSTRWMTAVHLSLGSGSFTPRYNSVHLAEDGTLEIHYSAVYPPRGTSGTDDMNYRFALLSLDNRYLEHVKKVELVYDGMVYEEDDLLYAKMPQYMPIMPGWGYSVDLTQNIDAEELYKGYRNYLVFDEEIPEEYDSVENGVYVLRSMRAFEQMKAACALFSVDGYFLDEIVKRVTISEDYFKTKSLVIGVGKDGGTIHTMELTGFNLTGSTLSLSASWSSYPEPGVPYAAPTVGYAVSVYEIDALPYNARLSLPEVTYTEPQIPTEPPTE